jgi:hypothetical protein
LLAVVFFAFADAVDADFFAAEAFAAVCLATAAFIALDIGSVLSEVEAGSGGGAAGAAAACLAASCQFGKNNSMRWREIELARRQRGQ